MATESIARPLYGGCRRLTAVPRRRLDHGSCDREHHEGVLSMARSADPNSAGSQFFVCLGRDHCQHLDGQYTAFGKVIEGIESVRTIGGCDLGPGDAPTEPQVMNQVSAVTD